MFCNRCKMYYNLHVVVHRIGINNHPKNSYNQIIPKRKRTFSHPTEKNNGKNSSNKLNRNKNRNYATHLLVCAF